MVVDVKVDVPSVSDSEVVIWYVDPAAPAFGPSSKYKPFASI